MAKIDDPTGKIEEHYFPKEDWERQLASEITDQGLLPLIPVVGWLAVLIRNSIKGKTSRGELLSLCAQIVDLSKAQGLEIDQLKESIPTDERMLRLASVATERTLWGANEKKRNRFAAVVAGTFANAVSDQEYEDAAYFIRALDELSEDDIRVLKYFYEHQADIVTDGHTMTYDEFFTTARMRVVWEGIGKLGMQMDHFYARCYRLAGYGLMMPIERKIGNGPTEHLFFRITLLAKRLVMLLETPAS